jgi:hypothetical protein
MVYITRFIKIGVGISKLLRGIHIQTQQDDIICLLFVFQIKDTKLREGRGIFIGPQIIEIMNVRNYCQFFEGTGKVTFCHSTNGWLRICLKPTE